MYIWWLPISHLETHCHVIMTMGSHIAVYNPDGVSREMQLLPEMMLAGRDKEGGRYKKVGLLYRAAEK